MPDEKPDVLLLGPPKPVVVNGLAAAFTVHRLPENDAEASLAALAPRLRAIAVSSVTDRVDAGSRSSRPSGSDTTISMRPGPPPVASWSPTRPTC